MKSQRPYLVPLIRDLGLNVDAMQSALDLMLSSGQAAQGEARRRGRKK